MHNRTFHLRVSLPALLAVAGLGASAFAQDRLSRGDRRWMEEVDPIMTEQERELFQEIQARLGLSRLAEVGREIAVGIEVACPLGSG